MSKKLIDHPVTIWGVVCAWVLILVGSLAMADHQNRLVEANEAQAQASYTAYVTEAHAENTLHDLAYATYVRGRYNDAKSAWQAAVQAANDTVTNASGKIDASELVNALPALTLSGDTQYMRAAAAELAIKTQATNDAVAAWQAEQDRIAAEQAAAEEAARQATEQSYSESYTDDSGSYSEPTPSGGGADYTLYVYGWGDQSAIDACAGAVWFTYYGGAGLAEHWSCGGSSFPEWAGAVIDIPGVGVYQSIGVIAVMDSTVLSAYDAPFGYADLFYQTCYGGDPHQTVFIGLERIG